jgi:hypothetical protein
MEGQKIHVKQKMERYYFRGVRPSPNLHCTAGTALYVCDSNGRNSGRGPHTEYSISFRASLNSTPIRSQQHKYTSSAVLLDFLGSPFSLPPPTKQSFRLAISVAVSDLLPSSEPEQPATELARRRGWVVGLLSP